MEGTEKKAGIAPRPGLLNNYLCGLNRDHLLNKSLAVPELAFKMLKSILMGVNSNSAAPGGIKPSSAVK
jgi:hypothetical protein